MDNCIMGRSLVARPFSWPRNSHFHHNDLESHVRTSGARKRKYREGWQMVEGALLTIAKEQADRQAGSADATIGTVTRDDSLELQQDCWVWDQV